MIPYDVRTTAPTLKGSFLIPNDPPAPSPLPWLGAVFATDEDSVGVAATPGTTAVANEMVAQVRAPLKNPGCLGDRCYSNLSWPQRLENQQLLASELLVKTAPPHAVAGMRRV